MAEEKEKEEKENKIPPPPSSTVKVRTMESDLESLKATGGATSQGYEVKLEKKDGLEKSKSLNIPGYVGKEKTIFESSPTTPKKPEPETSPKESKKIPLIIITTVIAVGLALVLYFFIFPRLFPR